MPEYVIVLALVVLPALGNLGGGLLAEAVRVSNRMLSLALHGAAGIVIAVVAVELMPKALAQGPDWLMVLAFVLGGGFFIVVDQAIGLIQNRRGGAAGKTGPWAIYFGVAVDLFSDGVMIGAGSTVTLGLGLLLALGQVPADIPEGFATIATFKRMGVARRTRLLLAASFALPIVIGATIGYWGVRGQPAEVQFALLAFTAGILTTVVVEEIVPEAHRGDDAIVATLMFIGGFALFTLLSSYL